MKFDRPTVVRVLYAVVVIVVVTAGIAGGDATGGLIVAAFLVATWGLGEMFSRRGSAFGDEIVGRGDERVDQISRDAALGTVYTLVALSLGYVLYTMAAGIEDDRYAPALTVFAIAWAANYVIARWRPLGIFAPRAR